MGNLRPDAEDDMEFVRFDRVRMPRVLAEPKEKP